MKEIQLMELIEQGKLNEVKELVEEGEVGYK